MRKERRYAKLNNVEETLSYRARQLVKMFSQHVLFPIVYEFFRRKPVNPNQVIFADAHRRECPQKMLRLKRALEEQDFSVTEYFFDVQSMGAFSGMKKMLDFMRLYAQAGFVVLQDNFLPVSSCRKKRETTVIQLWHGCGAFKRFGYDAPEDIPECYRGNVFANYNLIPVSSEACVKPFCSAMGCVGKQIVKPMGVSDTDNYFDSEFLANVRDKFRKNYPLAEGKKVILWAPSFRGPAAMARGKKPMGEQAVDALEGEGYFVIKSLHPHCRKANSMTSGELLVCADLVITDYSSIFFEALLLDKPVLFFAPDLEEYRENRGFYLDYNRLPGPVVRDPSWLLTAVNHTFSELAAGDDSYNTARRRFAEIYMKNCDGHATRRLVNYMVHRKNRLGAKKSRQGNGRKEHEYL